MDPTAAYKLIQDALANREPAEAAEHARDLIEWLGKGGFLPAQCVDRRQLLAYLSGIIETAEAAAPQLSPAELYAKRHDIPLHVVLRMSMLANNAADQGEKECNGDPNPHVRDRSDKNANSAAWGKTREQTLARLTKLASERGLTVQVNGLRPTLHRAEDGTDTHLP